MSQRSVAFPRASLSCCEHGPMRVLPGGPVPTLPCQQQIPWDQDCKYIRISIGITGEPLGCNLIIMRNSILLGIFKWRTSIYTTNQSAMCTQKAWFHLPSTMPNWKYNRKRNYTKVQISRQNINFWDL